MKKTIKRGEVITTKRNEATDVLVTHYAYDIVRNPTDQQVIIPKGTALGDITKVEVGNPKEFEELQVIEIGVRHDDVENLIILSRTLAHHESPSRLRGQRLVDTPVNRPIERVRTCLPRVDPSISFALRHGH